MSPHKSSGCFFLSRNTSKELEYPHINQSVNSISPLRQKIPSHITRQAAASREEPHEKMTAELGINARRRTKDYAVRARPFWCNERINSGGMSVRGRRSLDMPTPQAKRTTRHQPAEFRALDRNLEIHFGPLRKMPADAGILGVTRWRLSATRSST